MFSIQNLNNEQLLPHFISIQFPTGHNQLPDSSQHPLLDAHLHLEFSVYDFSSQLCTLFHNFLVSFLNHAIFRFKTTIFRLSFSSFSCTRHNWSHRFYIAEQSRHFYLSFPLSLSKSIQSRLYFCLFSKNHNFFSWTFLPFIHSLAMRKVFDFQS